jgi:hypothetical protein
MNHILRTAQGKFPGAQNFRSPEEGNSCMQDVQKLEGVINGVGKFGALGLIEILVLGGQANAEIIATVLGAR